MDYPKSHTIPPARADGRPLFFDISPTDRVQCLICVMRGQKAKYPQGEAFICDPANSPRADGASYTVCKEHIPEDSVIFNPGSGHCRTKSGDANWVEA